MALEGLGEVLSVFEAKEWNGRGGTTGRRFEVCGGRSGTVRRRARVWRSPEEVKGGIDVDKGGEDRREEKSMCMLVGRLGSEQVSLGAHGRLRSR